MGIKTVLIELIGILVIIITIFAGGVFLEYEIKQPKLDAANSALSSCKQSVKNKNTLIEQYNQVAQEQLNDILAQKQRADQAEKALTLVKSNSSKELAAYIKKVQTDSKTCPGLKNHICPSAMDY